MLGGAQFVVEVELPRPDAFEVSSTPRKSTENEESQKLHARTLDGSTAPHCKQVLVTDKFCAADASTPVRRVQQEFITTQSESCLNQEANVSKDLSGEICRKNYDVDGWR
jgi:hypothetical protein